MTLKDSDRGWRKLCTQGLKPILSGHDLCNHDLKLTRDLGHSCDWCKQFQATLLRVLLTCSEWSSFRIGFLKPLKQNSPYTAKLSINNCRADVRDLLLEGLSYLRGRTFHLHLCPILYRLTKCTHLSVNTSSSFLFWSVWLLVLLWLVCLYMLRGWVSSSFIVFKLYPLSSIYNHCFIILIIIWSRSINTTHYKQSQQYISNYKRFSVTSLFN